MAIRPALAASLIVVWHNGSGEPHFLMGKRRDDLAFLPAVMVFPGGKVERGDHSAPSAGLELSPACAQALLGEAPGVKPSALVHAALREAREETGFDASCGLSGPLTYLARAITPPRFAKRYDTRFFLGQVADTSQPPTLGPGDGELLGAGWFTPDALRSLPLHHVTQAVLTHAVACLAGAAGTRDRLLVADRRPKRWQGQAPLRSAALQAAHRA